MKRIIILIIFVFLFIATAFAETSIKAEVDKTSITTDETLTYKLSITSSEKTISAPQIPKFEGFRLVSQSQYSIMSLEKSELKTVLVYEFILIPNQIGTFTIKPCVIKIKDKSFSTDTFKIEVKPGINRPNRKSSQPEKSLPESEQPQFTL